MHETFHAKHMIFMSRAVFGKSHLSNDRGYGRAPKCSWKKYEMWALSSAPQVFIQKTNNSFVSFLDAVLYWLYKYFSLLKIFGSGELIPDFNEIPPAATSSKHGQIWLQQRPTKHPHSIHRTFIFFFFKFNVMVKSQMDWWVVKWTNWDRIDFYPC